MRKLCILAPAWALLLSNMAFAATVTIPSGTRIFGELQQEVTSDVKEYDVGDLVEGRVWRNIVVDGQTVVSAGAPMILRVSDINKRKVFGRAGSVEVSAVSVTAVDGTEIFLEGGYDRKGENRIVLSSTLAALVVWPTLFIKGREAVLRSGTIFDAAIPASTNVTIPDGARPTVRLGAMSDLTAEILYDELTEDSEDLPLRATLCDRPWSEPFEVTAVNDAPIDAIAINVTETTAADDCQVATGLIDLKDLSDHFDKGINRFSVSVGGESTEVILDVEM